MTQRQTARGVRAMRCIVRLAIRPAVIPPSIKASRTLDRCLYNESFVVNMSASVAESLPSSPIPAATMGGAAYRAPRGPSSELFDPNKHLAYEPPSERFSFEDLGFSNDLGIGSVALTLPFRLVRSTCAIVS